MDDDDFRALIEVLQGQLRDIGAGDIADEQHYIQVNGEDGVRRLLDPQKRLIEMLRAFARKLAVEDRGTYVEALSRMERTLRSEGPRGAIYEPITDEGRERTTVDLADAPDLTQIRYETRLLINRLAETRLPPRGLT